MIKCKKIAALIAATMVLTSGRYVYAADLNVSNEQSSVEVTTSENSNNDSYGYYENDTNALKAIKIDSSTTIEGTIDSSLDNDWYVMSLDSNYPQKTISVKVSDSVNLDVYVDLGEGNLYKLTPLPTGSYTAYPDYPYYIKVSDKENGNESYPKSYTLQTERPVVYASNVSILDYEGASYDNTLDKFVCHKNSNLTVKGTVTSADGERLANRPIQIKFYDKAWANHTKQESSATAEGTGYTDSNGNYIITLKLPEQGLGEYPVGKDKHADLCSVQVSVLDGSGAYSIDNVLMQID